MRLLLIDGNSILYRSYFGLADANLRSSRGEPTGCVMAFMNTMIAAIRVHDITHAMVAFDTKGKNTIRHRVYPEYKATRKPKKFDLSQDFKITKHFLKEINIPQYNNGKYEADDIVGSMVKKYEDQAETITILGGDKDYAQLVTDTTSLYLFNTQQKGFVNMGPREIEEKYGVPPELIVDYLTLVGDKSDNLPGVDQIGKGTAPKLLNKYGSIEGIYANLNDLTEKKKECFINCKEQAKLTHKLATIFTRVEVPISLDQMSLNTMDYEGWDRMLKWYELASMEDAVNALKLEFNQKPYKKSKANLDSLIGN